MHVRTDDSQTLSRSPDFSPKSGTRVRDRGGAEAVVVREADAELNQVLIELGDGKQVLVPRDALSEQNDGTYRVSIEFGSIGRDMGLSQPTTIPVIQERLNIEKRLVTKGGYRITKTVESREEVVDEALMREEVSVERVQVNEIVPHSPPPQVRYEGDMMIVPVVEEVFVVEKRLLLKEEVRVRRAKAEYRAPQRVVLRGEKVVVEQIDEAGKTVGLVQQPSGSE